MSRLRIARRFNGPEGIANGGLAAGLVARQVDVPVAVRLSKPVPLETDLTVVQADVADRWDVRDGDLVVASASKAAELTLAPPLVPSYEEAVNAAKTYPGLGSPRFSGCFVCGAGRPNADGLSIFSGRLAQPNMVAAPWTPATDLADAHGQVRSEVVWAALDCPGYFAAFADQRYALLGELSVRVDAPVIAGEPYVVLGWTIAHEGRKRRAGTALLDTEGRCLAVGQATWIEVAART